MPVSARFNARRLAVAPEPECQNHCITTVDFPSCSLCFGTGMEVVAGRGRATADVTHVEHRLNSSHRHASHAATRVLDSQITTRRISIARSFTPSATLIGLCMSTRQ